jgi:hypothetical protein
MAENIQRSKGRSQSYKFDRGGMPAEMGPYIGIVVNNVDDTRSGRLQVYIEAFGATQPDGKPNLTDPTLWRTVSYCPPFYGATPQVGTNAGAGTYPGNRNSYGMWFTPPDLGVSVLCFFVNGDPGQGYYVGCIPEPGINHMIPAIGSSSKYVAGNAAQQQLFGNSPLLPVTEINTGNEAINENPRFFDQPKPVQSVQAAIYFQQGLNQDPIRGPIRSSSQRESPSSVYGISTPGKPIYNGVQDPKTIKSQLEQGTLKPQDVAVVGRQGGHTFVMDDGDLEGTDALVRIRTAKGHQITMSDNGDSFYITHANGQTWLEFGKQGTVDVYSTNSINLRTQGTLNLHADKNINMYAGGSIKMKSKGSMIVNSESTIGINGEKNLLLYSKESVSIRSDGNLAMKGAKSSWNGGSSLNFRASKINLNGAPTLPTGTVPSLAGFKLAGTTFVNGRGWIVQPGTLETIVTRAPTHEPYPYHNTGVNNSTDLNDTLTIPDGEEPDTSDTITGVNSENVNQAYLSATSTVVENPLQIQDFLKELPSSTAIGTSVIANVTTIATQSVATATSAATTTAQTQANAILNSARGSAL